MSSEAIDTIDKSKSVRFQSPDTSSQGASETLSTNDSANPNLNVLNKEESSHPTHSMTTSLSDMQEQPATIRSSNDNATDRQRSNDVLMESLLIFLHEFQSGKRKPVSDFTEPNMGRKKFFGLSRGLSSDTRSNNRFDYDQKYPRDRPGEELGDNARVWLTYLDEAEAYDRDKVEGWKDTADILLVFAGLFSGVITTFLSQASQNLQQDYTQVSASLLSEMVQLQRAFFSGTPITDVPISTLTPTSPFTPSTNAFFVNGLWFTSLAITLSTALFAVLTKQGLYYYMSAVSGTALEKMKVRHFRFQGLEVWKVGFIIDLLPVLLHLALAIFLVGIVILLFPLDFRVAWIVAAIAGFTFILYIISVILPIRYPQCPYATSLTTYVGVVFFTLSAVLHTFREILFESTGRVGLWVEVYRTKVACSYRETILCFHWHFSRYLFRRPSFTPTTMPQFTFADIYGAMRVLRLYEDSVPLHLTTNWREHNQKEAIANTVSLDRQALSWLHTISPNPSVRRVIARAVFVHPGSVYQDFGSIFKELSQVMDVNNTEFEDLRYGLCMDVRLNFPGPEKTYWNQLRNTPDANFLDEPEYRSYAHIADSVLHHDYAGILKDAIDGYTTNGFKVQLPLVLWRSFLLLAASDATLAAGLLTSDRFDPFDWGHGVETESISNTNAFPFDSDELKKRLSKHVFVYLFRCFFNAFPDDYSAHECYLLFVKIYRNLTSDEPFIADVRLRQEFLGRLFSNFLSSLYPTPSNVSSEQFQELQADILAPDVFWKEPMTDAMRKDAVVFLKNIWISYDDIYKTNRFLFSKYRDLLPLYKWCSQDASDTALVAPSSMVTPLFMLQNYASLRTVLMNDPDALVHFPTCFKKLASEDNWIKRKCIYPYLLRLLKSLDMTAPVLVQIWMLLVKSGDASVWNKEFVQIVRSKLSRPRLRVLYVNMIEEIEIISNPDLYESAYYIKELETSMLEFGRNVGITGPTSSASVTVSESTISPRRNISDVGAFDLELYDLENERINPHSSTRRVRNAFESVLQTLSVNVK